MKLVSDWACGWLLFCGYCDLKQFTYGEFAVMMEEHTLGCINFLETQLNEKPISRSQLRQAEVVALHVTHAAIHMNEVMDKREIGVVITGKGEQICKRAPRGITQSGVTAGGCRQVWKEQILAT